MKRWERILTFIFSLFGLFIVFTLYEYAIYLKNHQCGWISNGTTSCFVSCETYKCEENTIGYCKYLPLKR